MIARLFAWQKPWLAQRTTRASGNAVSTRSAVSSCESLSTTTTSRSMSPACSKTVDRQGRSQCASLVETMMIARSCMSATNAPDRGALAAAAWKIARLASVDWATDRTRRGTPHAPDPHCHRRRGPLVTALGRMLVTGGAGAIGSNVVDELVLAGAEEVVVVDNFVRGRRENLAWAQRNAHVTVIDGDIRDRALVGRLMDGVDVVFHLAAIRITQCAEEPRLANEVLVDGSFNVFEAAVEAGVRRVVASSSASVYGLADTFPTDERHHPYANDTFYGAAKAFNEGTLRSMHAMHGLDYVALRYFNVYGPRMDVHGLYTEVLVRWMERIDAGEPPLILGDGLQTMGFVYIGDVARSNVLAAQSDLTDAVFNVASGTETSLLELARMLLAVMESDLPVAHGPARAVNGVTRRLADTAAAREQFGFEAEVDLEEGLRRLVEWWRGERAGASTRPIGALGRAAA